MRSRRIHEVLLISKNIIATLKHRTGIAADHALPTRGLSHKLVLGSLCVLLMTAQNAYSTSSTTFWTPMTIDIQSFGVPHIGIDNYFRSTGASSDGAFPTDFTSPTIGFLPWNKIQGEVGTDYFANTPHPWLFNFKIGSPESSFFKKQPAFEIGTFLLAKKTSTSRTDYDVIYGVVGKSFRKLGRVSAGPYAGNHKTLVSSNGQPANTGYMIAFDHAFAPVKDANGGDVFNRYVFAIDYASGKNYIGGSGGGLYIYFTKDLSLLVGPTFFNDKGTNGSWKWSTQLDINLPKIIGRRPK